MTYDVAIIGAGVVGCAIFRRFCLGGASATLLIEKGADILSGASKGNSAMLHTGYDARAAAWNWPASAPAMRNIWRSTDHLNLPLLETGGLLVAWNEAEAGQAAGDRRAGARQRRRRCACSSTRRSCAGGSRNLAPAARAAVVIPGEHIIDPWSPSLAYVLQGMAHGGEVRRATEVHGRRFRKLASGRLRTSNGPVAGARRRQCGRQLRRSRRGHSPPLALSPSSRARASSWSSTSRPRGSSRSSSCRCRPSAPRA